MFFAIFMPSYKIQGGYKLKGEISVGLGKNSPVALLCATLLLKAKTHFKEMPKVEEVFRMIEILESVGVKVGWGEDQSLVVDTSMKLDLKKINKKVCRATRVSLLLLGALAAREKSYRLYKSGGCKLGSRTVKPHTLALEKFGIRVQSKAEFYEVHNQPLKSAHVVMYESGDTPTENAIMAAVLAKGITTIKMASANYMVQDLCYFLVSAGASIHGIGTTTLVIEGGKKLHGVQNYSIIPDPVDAMAWISLAVTTKSNITIKNCPLEFLELELEKLCVMGQKFRIEKKRKSKSGFFDIGDIVIETSRLKALPDKIYGRPFPGLNIDSLPFFVPIATQAKGQTLIHDWPYENRAVYGLEFQKLGVNVMLMDPHRLLVQGPAKLKPNDIECPPAIRPGMAILIAMIAAKGNSILRNVYPIERAYENVMERLHGLGVHIQREE